jgi:signal transduction histidine kinase
MGVDPGAVLTRELIHHGFGLTCMRERLQAIGGRFTLRGTPGAGPCIRAQAAARAPA